MKSNDIKKLIQGCVKHKPKAQKALYDFFAPKMMAVCLRYTKEKADAEDIFQDGFIKVYNKIHQLEQPEMLEWWMKKIFINEALQLYKQRKKITFAHDNNFTNLTNREADQILGRLGIEEINKAIRSLPTGMQLIVDLYIIEGLPHKEIAKLLGISEGTSKSQLHDARKILKEKLQDFNKE